MRQRFNSLVKAGKVYSPDVTVQRSKYKAEYCEEVIKMASAGYSFRAFCGHIGVCFRTGTSWRAALPEFDQACREADMKRHLFYEHTGLKNLHNRDFNHALFKGLTSSIVNWKDRNEITVHNDSDLNVNISTIEPNLLTPHERREKIKQLAAELKIDP